MKVQFILCFLTLFFCNYNCAQGKLICKDGTATFFSKAPMENIEAENEQVLSILDQRTGKVAVKMLIKQFEFEKSLMQEHFNENYMQSDKFPSATFTGGITNYEEVNLNEDGTYIVEIDGQIEIHGVKKPLVTTAKFVVENGEIAASVKFKVKTADFEIKVPKLVVKNIAEQIEVTLGFRFSALNG